MNRKRLFIPFILVSAAAALAFRRIAQSLAKPKAAPARVKPVSKNASYDAIDAYIEGQMRRLHIPGLSLAIVEGDQIVHVHGFGWARPGGDVPTPQTPFFIGSLTKSITALAVMQLVEAGKADLDAPVQRYLPWFSVADPQASAQMTVRHLLNQTSGLPQTAGQIFMTDADIRPDATERQVRALSTLKLTHPVGKVVQYCNQNYNILGLIIEAASGEKYTDYLQNHIFNPLGMCRSYASRAEAQKHGLAVGYRHWFSLPFPAPDLPIPSGSLPAGQLISTAEDMTHYLIAHINGGRYGEAQVLSPAGIDELHRGAAEYVMFGISGGRYGMGWFDKDIGQTKIYYHGGNCPEFSTFMALIPEQKKGFVMLFNADPYGLPPIMGEVGMGVAALLAGQEPAPIQYDFIQWVMRLLPLIPLLQVAGAAATLTTLRRWHKDPALRPGSGRLWRQHILLPLVPNLALASILAALRSTRMLEFVKLFMPDIALIARISGTFAALWAPLRTGLILWTLEKPGRQISG